MKLLTDANKTRLPLTLLAACIAMLALPVTASAQTVAGGRSTAICSPGDQPETGMQGETPLKDVESGRNKSPYYCGMRIVGSLEMNMEGGGGVIIRRSRSCAYVSGVSNNGLAVIDVSNPAMPKTVGFLKDPGTIGTSENMDVIDLPDRHVLVAGKYSSALTSDSHPMSIYDITDCTKPKLMSTYNWPGDVHVPTITPDGKQVFVSRPFGVAGVMALDITDLSNPKFIGSFPLLLPGGRQARCHDLTFNDDGTRMYCPGSVPTEADRESEPGPSIWDVSQISSGKRNLGWPPIHFVGEADIKGQGDHHAARAMINGKPYLIVGSELGCVMGKSDFPSIFDISDERAPRKVSEFRLEVMEHCVADSAFLKEHSRQSYNLHYNDVVDNAWGNVALGLFGYYGSGVRIVDLRDPLKPREVAYYKPGALAATTGRGTASAAGSAAGAPGAANRGGRTRIDATPPCGSHQYFVHETGHIWFACTSGFYVAELSPAVKANLGVSPTTKP